MILKMKRCPPGNRIQFHNVMKNFVMTRDEIPEDAIWLKDKSYCYVWAEFAPDTQNSFTITHYVQGVSF